MVMYELLTERRLFDAPEQATILDRVRSLPIPAPSQANPEVPAAVDQIVLTALARDPAKRWQSAGDMRDAIGRAAAGRLTQKQFVSWVEWAFSQKQPLRREDSGVSALHEIIQSKDIQVVGELPAISEAMMERRRESVAMMPALGAAMLQRRSSGRWLWLALILAACAAALVLHAAGLV